MTPASDTVTPVPAAYSKLPEILRSYTPAFLAKAAEIVLDRQAKYWEAAGHNGANDNTMMRLHLNDTNCPEPGVWSAAGDILREGAKAAGGRTVQTQMDEASATFVLPNSAVQSARAICEEMRKNFGSQEVKP